MCKLGGVPFFGKSLSDHYPLGLLLSYLALLITL